MFPFPSSLCDFALTSLIISLNLHRPSERLISLAILQEVTTRKVTSSAWNNNDQSLPAVMSGFLLLDLVAGLVSDLLRHKVHRDTPLLRARTNHIIFLTLDRPFAPPHDVACFVVVADLEACGGAQSVHLTVQEIVHYFVSDG